MLKEKIHCRSAAGKKNFGFSFLSSFSVQKKKNRFFFRCQIALVVIIYFKLIFQFDSIQLQSAMGAHFGLAQKKKKKQRKYFIRKQINRIESQHILSSLIQIQKEKKNCFD